MTNGQRRPRAQSRRVKRRSTQKKLIPAFLVLISVAAVIIIIINGGRADDEYLTPAPASETVKAEPPDAARAALLIETAAPDPAYTPGPSPTPTPGPAPEPAPSIETIAISFAGDCTLGGDMLGPSEKRFYQTVSKSDEIDYEYCFKNVRDIFAGDDLTVINLEAVLTRSSAYVKPPKGGPAFIMRGRPEYVKFLTNGNIEVANIANNHITDFGEEGIAETIEHLDGEGIRSFGRERSLIIDIKGARVGFVGFSVWRTSNELLEQMISDTRANCDILIVSFHWGSELQYNATNKQKEYGRKAVDMGADLVIGHHPHVINGIEVYKGVNIVYSLGNFCFGGKENPADKDTFIYRHTFSVRGEELLSGQSEIIPCRITSGSKNNYQPTPATGKTAASILDKIEKYSKPFNNPFSMKDIGTIYD